jgi:hypothetical protein
LPDDISKKFLDSYSNKEIKGKDTIAGFDSLGIHLNLDILSKLFDQNGIKDGKAQFLETLINMN